MPATDDSELGQKRLLVIAHILALALIAVLLIVGGTNPQSVYDFSDGMLDCLDETSWARPAAVALWNDLGGPELSDGDGTGGNCDTFAEVETTWGKLREHLHQNSGGTAETVWLGYASGEGQFYGVQDCRAEANMNTAYCLEARSRYVMEVASPRVFNDKKLRRYDYAVGEGTGFSLLSTAFPYDPRVRPWYFFGMGSGVNGTWGSYVDSFQGEGFPVERHYKATDLTAIGEEAKDTITGDTTRSTHPSKAVTRTAFSRTFHNGVVTAVTMLHEEQCWKASAKERGEDASEWAYSEEYHPKHAL